MLMVLRGTINANKEPLFLGVFEFELFNSKKHLKFKIVIYIFFDIV